MKSFFLFFIVTSLSLSAQTEISSSRYQIVFGSFRDGDFASSIFSISVNGDNLKLVSRHKEGKPNCLDPKVSPDFKKIIFARGTAGHQTSIWSMQSDGTNEKKLTGFINSRFRNNAKASFSSDGSQFIYGSNISHDSNIFLGNINNDDVRNLTLNKGKNKSAEWHPIENKIVFNSDREGIYKVYILNLAQNTPQLVTPKDMEASFPSWSPNGDYILFSGSTDGKQYDLYKIKANGTELTQITDTPSLSERDGVYSPDSKYIVFEAKPADSPRNFERSIYLIEIKTGEVKKLTKSKFHDFSASWILVEK